MNSVHIKYEVISEIRHGSPYNLAKLYVADNSFYIQPDAHWQDKHAWSQDNRYLAQIQWAINNDEPGFFIMMFDRATGEVVRSKRIIGCCNELFLGNDLIIHYETYTLVSFKNEKQKYGLVKGTIQMI
ncbi:MAG: hypothetical protein V4642_08410 [Bacteroidota bacterium]